MAWQEILNHESVVERFRRSYQRNRIASTYLFVGPPGIGKQRFALELAKTLLCEGDGNEFESCGKCPACQQVQAKTHPDLILVSKPKDKAFIPLELFIGDKEHRRREGLCHEIGLKPFRGGRKIAIVNDADALNQEGANCLLKTLEEPPPNSILILIGSTEKRQLPTIISRSQVIRFQPLSTEQLVTLLTKQHANETAEDISLEQIAAAAEGSMDLAQHLLEPETREFRQELFDQLATGDPGRNDFAKTVMAFLDAAGKEAAQKRLRLCLAADFSIAFYRKGYLSSLDPCESTETVVKKWASSNPASVDIASEAIQRCVELQYQVHANVSPANAVEAWLMDLGKINRRKYQTRI